MICPNCKYENNNANIKCEHCGIQLINVEEINPNLCDEPKLTKEERITEDAKLESFSHIYSGIGTLLSGSVFTGVCFMILIKGAGMFEKIIIIPFLISGIAVLISGTSMLLKGLNIHKTLKYLENGNDQMIDELKNKNKMLGNISKIGNYIYTIGFLLFWFGFLIFMDYHAIKTWSDGGNRLFFSSFIFWITGIIVAIKKLKK